MPGKGPELFALDTDRGTATFSLTKGLYPMDAIYGAAYVMIDRAYVLLDKGDTGDVLVHITAKKGKLDEQDALKLAGEFTNEALSQVLRGRVMREQKARMETIVAQAIGGALGFSMGEDMRLDALDEDDDDLDFLDDPLGIAVPWEEKFKKSAREDRPETATPSDEPGPGDSGGFRPVKPEGPSS